MPALIVFAELKFLKKLLYLCFCCFYLKWVLVQLLVPFFQNFTGPNICRSPHPIFLTCHHFLVCVDQNRYYFIVCIFHFINLRSSTLFLSKIIEYQSQVYSFALLTSTSISIYKCSWEVKSYNCFLLLRKALYILLSRWLCVHNMFQKLDLAQLTLENPEISLWHQLIHFKNKFKAA